MLSIQAIPIFSDNYVWLISCSATRHALVVDPGSAQEVLDVLKRENLSLQGVLITHWHPDHIGGLADLQQAHQSKLIIYGPDSPKIPRINEIVNERSQLNLLGADFQVLDVPGHTLEHLAYYSPALNSVFCGDTLFAAGCGRMFEGTPEVMHHSLQKLAQLPEDTLVYCAHEYTLSNLKFARAAEPDNQDIVIRYQEVKAMRSQGKMSIPSNIALERRTNPFLRTQSPAIINALKARDLEYNSDWQVFASLRKWKDNF